MALTAQRRFQIYGGLAGRALPCRFPASPDSQSLTWSVIGCSVYELRYFNIADNEGEEEE